jgi:hypothetical protein
LDKNSDEHDREEWLVVINALEDVELACLKQSGVDLVEDLHEHECVEDEREEFGLLGAEAFGGEFLMYNLDELHPRAELMPSRGGEFLHNLLLGLGEGVHPLTVMHWILEFGVWVLKEAEFHAFSVSGVVVVVLKEKIASPSVEKLLIEFVLFEEFPLDADTLLILFSGELFPDFILIVLGLGVEWVQRVEVALSVSVLGALEFVVGVDQGGGAGEEDDQESDHLVNGVTLDVSAHNWGDDGVVFLVWLSFKNIEGWWLCGKTQSSESIHN